MSQPEGGAETQTKYLGIVGIFFHQWVADAFEDVKCILNNVSDDATPRKRHDGEMDPRFEIDDNSAELWVIYIKVSHKRRVSHCELLLRAWPLYLDYRLVNHQGKKYLNSWNCPLTVKPMAENASNFISSEI